jgi:methionyl-tRNA formyltransferase
MGTPEFAVAPLDALVKKGYNITGVVTVPDKPSGRGLKLNQSAVKQYAVENLVPNGTRLMQPVSLKDEGFLAELKELDADILLGIRYSNPSSFWKA